MSHLKWLSIAHLTAHTKSLYSYVLSSLNEASASDIYSIFTSLIDGLELERAKRAWPSHPEHKTCGDVYSSILHLRLQQQMAVQIMIMGLRRNLPADDILEDMRQLVFDILMQSQSMIKKYLPDTQIFN